LHLPQDKTFVITAPSNNEQNVYVQKRQLNGVDDNRTWITHQDLLPGGELHLVMGPDANMRPIPDADLPYSVTP
jgi:putative alpha-1,2-mannosidase